jgi:RNA recognition motif-containing protein
LSLALVTVNYLLCIVVILLLIAFLRFFLQQQSFIMNIYVSNLSFNVQDEDLREFFTPYGEVSSAKIITDKLSGKSRGFGFVEMPDDAAAAKAVAELDSSTVDGRTIKVTEAKPKEDRPRGGGGGGGYRGGNDFGGGGGGGYKKKW